MTDAEQSSTMEEVEVGDIVSWNDSIVTQEAYRANWQNVVVIGSTGDNIRVLGRHGLLGSWEKKYNVLVSKKKQPEPTDQELADKYRALLKELSDTRLILENNGFTAEFQVKSGAWLTNASLIKNARFRKKAAPLPPPTDTVL